MRDRREASLLPLFVYGTLMADGARAGLLGGGRRRAGRVRGALYAMPGGYPAFVPGTEGLVEGEVVDGLDEGRMRVVDLYEGVADGLYDRVDIDVDVDGKSVTAWTYVMARPEDRGGVRWPGTRWLQPRGTYAQTDRVRRGR